MNKGDRFNKLVFLGTTEKRGKRLYGEFQCDCGNKKFIRMDIAQRGTTKSCGCVYAQRKNRVNLDSATYETLYSVWRNMIRRCEDKTCTKYRVYGSRGITVCDEWHDFRTFADWAVASGWRKGLSIERRDVSSGYSPENCTIIELALQQQNKTNNIRIVIDGEEKCLSEWCRVLGFPFKRAWARWNRGRRDPSELFCSNDMRSCRGGVEG